MIEDWNGLFEFNAETERRWKMGDFLPERWLERPCAKRQFEIIQNWWPAEILPRVLDLGCGFGQHSQLPHSIYLGIDLNVARAKKMYPYLANCFIEKRFDRDPEPIEADVVLCTNVLRHYEDPVGVFEWILETYLADLFHVFTFLVGTGLKRGEWWQGQFSKAMDPYTFVDLGKKHRFEALRYFEEPKGVEWWLARVR